MKIVVFGGAGFIGYHLCRKLRGEGHEVLAVDNFAWSTDAPHGKTLYEDIRNTKIVDKWVAWADVVHHLAAQINVDYSIRYPQETIDINVGGTLNILEACRKYKKKLIFASTSEVYGSAQTERISESHPLDGQSPYAASKIAGDRLCKSYADTFGLDASILRSFNTFGTYQRSDSYGGVIAIFVDRVLHKKPPVIFGDGTQQRDYIWITDALEGYDIAARESLGGRPVNIASGQSVSVADIARLVIQYIHPGMEPVHTPPRPGEVQRLTGDITFAKSLGFAPKTDFEKHLREYIDWRKKHYER